MNDGTAHIPQHGKSTYPILIPLPDHDFDPTEAAIPWKTLHSQGWKISFSTERGVVAEADHNKFTGPLPGLISASAEAREAYHEMVQDASFQHPIAYGEIDASQYQALLLPGGDGLRMRQYLESEILQRKVLDFCRLGKLIGAICHGILYWPAPLIQAPVKVSYMDAK
jgi:putative intracellular protease/amidase